MFAFLTSKKVGILPARWGSSRFPGKPLIKILGKTLIQRSYENALNSRSLDCVVVATDDQRIFDHVVEFGGLCVMTSKFCANGTERVEEAISQHFPQAEIVVNIQGDEPCLSPSIIDGLVAMLEDNPSANMVTPVTETVDPEAILTDHKVKCVFDKTGKALYFSRSAIPYNFKRPTPVHLHIGVYAFRKTFLREYVKIPPSSLSLAEDLEQLRVLETGLPIHVLVVQTATGPSVDYPEDITKVEQYLLCLSKASF
ncbi:3-deoxy-manno-octulosonate cytidylyltransferase [Chlamydia sp.]|uniref:3-deoxy-manno-octulosonate cytidylyltransferase n=1 Tax=Chlamydia sp. TaxID=35827 RepID=UPI0025C0294F|nr:3-deoxy-manno-octulosonate cytidylyltransferase [Chlamydia sp.]MBQ8498382.1 3-deoxy-manno-octulosonate cytidylyltransferase [Chlamydia sp.]